ncbi:MAG: AAA family ATPase [Planctomycetota bacterium]
MSQPSNDKKSVAKQVAAAPTPITAATKPIAAAPTPIAAAPTPISAAQTPDTAGAPQYEFYVRLARILNSGQARSLLVAGDVHDLFFAQRSASAGEYLPMIPFLIEKCRLPGLIILVYELNGPVRFVDAADRERLRDAWVAWKSGTSGTDLLLSALADPRRERDRQYWLAEFDRNLRESIGQPTQALELMRQLTLCSRSRDPDGRRYLAESLLIIVEGADLLLPAGDGDLARLAGTDRHRISVVQDWFCDPAFLAADDAVVLLADSASLVHPRVARLPQVLLLEVPSPDLKTRAHYIEQFLSNAQTKTAPSAAPAAATRPPGIPQLWAGVAELARFTAGLSLHALRQLLIGAAHTGQPLKPEDVIVLVEHHITSQLGDDVVEFKKPEHSLNDVLGFSRLKQFIRDEMIPRLRATGPDALSGAAIAGPIGGGKTFIFEAVASALDLPVLVLKNIRSQWYGQTDVIFERLRRVLEALDKVVIFVDEADTQFGGVGAETQDTERRLTGKIQAMMADPRLRGRIVWLLMTARIHLLSADIRRPGRVGDLIIPVLDPSGADRREFLAWVLKSVRRVAATDDELARLDALTSDYSAAAFSSLRSQLRARAGATGGELPFAAIEEIVRDHLPPAIQRTRRYQTLQALVNCTRRSLLPDPTVSDDERAGWQREILLLEAQGIR